MNVTVGITLNLELCRKCVSILMNRWGFDYHTSVFVGSFGKCLEIQDLSILGEDGYRVDLLQFSGKGSLSGSDSH